jgi:hypothetical protein
MSKDTVTIRGLEHDLYPVEYVETLKKQIAYLDGYVCAFDDCGDGEEIYHEILRDQGDEDLIAAKKVDLKTFFKEDES